ncbi:hypothetical protein ACIPZC_12790 [Pseudomonas sp. NPDC089743]|uniref:hypothetical protein n=1 Tax=Pseudomonas sp. NPDC089743 TaxID=3364471 RepID=UPI00380B4A1D
MTDHDRLLAATHDHARDWREGKACGGQIGRHEQIFGEVNALDYSGESEPGQ